MNLVLNVAAVTILHVILMGVRGVLAAIIGNHQQSQDL